MYLRLSEGQTLADLAALRYGFLEALFDLCKTNNLSFDTAAVGLVVELPEVKAPKVSPVQVVSSVNPFVIIAANQALADIAIQEGGSMEVLFDLAKGNGKSITDDLAPGTLVRKPQLLDRKVTNLFKVTKPASNSPANLPEHLEGIDYWYIENTFIVS